MITFFFYLNVTDPLLIIPLIFIFLPCVVKRLMITTKFCCENYKSWPVKSNAVNISEQKLKCITIVHIKITS